jgi:Domain of unknown function (DUF1824)
MFLLLVLALLAANRISAFVVQQAPPCAHTILQCSKQPVAADEISTASSLLSAYDKAFLQRVKSGRAEGRTAAETEFQRAQSLGSQALLDERRELAEACKQLAAQADIVTLGIMAETGERGLQVLKQWVCKALQPDYNYYYSFTFSNCSSALVRLFRHLIQYLRAV